MSISYLEPSSLVWRSIIIWHICVFYHSSNNLLFYQYIFSEQNHMIFIGLFLKICNLFPFVPKDEYNPWLYSMLTESEFNLEKVFVRASTYLGKTHMSMANFFIPIFIKANYKRGWHLVHWVSPVRKNIFASFQAGTLTPTSKNTGYWGNNAIDDDK